MNTIDNNTHLMQADTISGASEPDMVKLTNLISAYAPHDGCFELRIPGVHAIRRSRTDKELVHAVTSWDAEAKKRRRDEVFPQDCKRAFELGAKLTAAASGL
jgi:hypothetical protein